ncbi:MAG TPA: ATP-binding protein [Vicinamibacteria bacterium]
MADLGRTSMRLGVALALSVVGLFEVLSIVQGVRSVRRLRARVALGAEQRVKAARPLLAGALEARGPAAWDAAAAAALVQGLASEVEVLDLDAGGKVLFSRPTVSPVAHAPRPEELRRLAADPPLSLVAQEGPVLRALVYVPLPGEPPGLVLRLAAPAPDLEDELRERRQVFLGHLASLAALALAAVLALVPREGGAAEAPPEGALAAYEQAMERLRDRGEAMTARHEAERHRMEEAIREKEALARAGELTAGIAHEVRNGLGTILGYARMLERSPLPEAEAEAARAIRAECDTLETVVRRFTDFVRLEKLRLGEADLARLLARVVARERRAHEEVRARLVGLDAPLVVQADEELLERAFENVVRNALEAAAAGGRTVEVAARGGAAAVEVTIDDDGPGLAPDHPGGIRPFYTTRPGGLGLGLPLARKIVLLHGGSLDLARREPAGTRVLILLPTGGPEA